MLQKLSVMSRKERNIMYIAVAVLGAMVLLRVFVFEGLGRITTLNRVLPQKREELERLRTLVNDQMNRDAGVKLVSSRIQSREEGFAVFTFLEEKARNLSITDSIVAMKPDTNPLDEEYSESVVEIEFEGISLTALVSYLFEIEKSEELLAVKRLEVNTARNNAANLDAVLEVVTLVPANT
jgi:type II secretory pathway component PulM